MNLGLLRSFYKGMPYVRYCIALGAIIAPLADPANSFVLVLPAWETESSFDCHLVRGLRQLPRPGPPKRRVQPHHP